MSLFGSLFSSASGLTAQSRALAMISDNISNVNTIGYKAATPDFTSIVTQQTSAVAYSPGGVRAVTGYEIMKQGLIQGTDSPTDAAISGGGFFVVNTRTDGTGEQLYTRDGSFSADRQGFLVTPAGFYLQGWELDADGNIVDINTLVPVNVRSISGTATATTRVELDANLDARQSEYTGAYTTGDMEAWNASGGTSGVQPHFSRQVRVYDSLGRGHSLTLAFLKTGTNTWEIELYADRAELDPNVHPTGLVASGTATFAGDGSLTAITGSLASPVAINWSSGADPSSITFDLGSGGNADGLTQFAAPADVAFVQQNGSEVGHLKGVSIDKDGYVVASFTTGAQRRIYRLPVATFANPLGLEPRTGNVFAETEYSGEYNLRFAGTSNAGRIAPGALETANVDLADEFTKMIVTQRAYTANARVVSTVNTMLDELMRITS